MTKEQTLALKENRLNTLKSNGKNNDSNGVVRKLTRQIRNIKNTIDK